VPKNAGREEITEKKEGKASQENHYRKKRGKRREFRLGEKATKTERVGEEVVKKGNEGAQSEKVDPDQEGGNRGKKVYQKKRRRGKKKKGKSKIGG